MTRDELWDQVMSSFEALNKKANGTAHCFIDSDLADEHYIFPIRFPPPTSKTQTTSVMIERLGNGNLIIAAQRLPGVEMYYNNYPEVVAEDPQLEASHAVTRDRVDTALEMLDWYNPQTYTAETASGNRALSAIWIEVSEKERDEALLQIWQVLNYLRRDYISFIDKWEPDKVKEYVREYELLEHEVAEIVE